MFSTALSREKTSYIHRIVDCEHLKPSEFFEQYSTYQLGNDAACIRYFHPERKNCRPEVNFAELCKKSPLIMNNLNEIGKFANWLHALYEDKPEMFIGNYQGNLNWVMKQLYDLSEIYKNENASLKRVSIFDYSGVSKQLFRECVWIVTPHLADYFLIPLTKADTPEIIHARFRSCTAQEECNLEGEINDNHLSMNVADKIIQELIDASLTRSTNVQEVLEPTFHIVTGPPGMGKSSIIKTMDNAIWICPDDIKAKLAEIGLGGACANQELSISLGIRLLNKVILDYGAYNIVFETSGTYPPYLEFLIRKAKSNGYKVIQHLVSLYPEPIVNSVQTLQERIVNRYHNELLVKKDNARFADPYWVLPSTITKHIEKIQSLHQYPDAAFLWSTCPGLTSSLTLVEEFSPEQIANGEIMRMFGSDINRSPALIAAA